MKRELLQRGVFGALYIAVMVMAIVLGPYVASGLFLVLSLCTLYEFYHLVRSHTQYRPLVLFGMVAGLLMFVAVFVATHRPGMRLLDGLMLGAALFALSFGVLLALLPFWLLYHRGTTPIANWGITILGCLYISLSFSLVSVLYVLGPAGESYKLVLYPLILVWVNDTGAYCVGNLIGKHKLIERISPTKTWEGFAGGLVLTILGGVLLSMFIPGASKLVWGVLGLLVGLLAVLGDLVESLIKRSLGVKDSGRFLPGHGGFLDRFDSVIFALMGSSVFFFIV